MLIGIMLSVIIPSALMVSSIMLSVGVLSVTDMSVIKFIFKILAPRCVMSGRSFPELRVAKSLFLRKWSTLSKVLIGEMIG